MDAQKHLSRKSDRLRFLKSASSVEAIHQFGAKYLVRA
jgi:hypothetical protein